MKKTYSCICPLKEHTIDLNTAQPVWKYVVETIETLGEDIEIICVSNEKTYLVPRIFICFHGLYGKELPNLGFPTV